MFSPSAVSEGRRLDMSLVRDWAQQIAAAYLSVSEDPTESLMKVAEEHELSGHQISVVAGEINKEIHRVKFASSKDNKYFAADFPLADAQRAISALQADDGSVKVAAIIPPPIFDKAEFDFHKAFGVEAEDMTLEKTAKLKVNADQWLEKAAVLQEKLADQRMIMEVAAKGAEASFIKQARQYVLSVADDHLGRASALTDLEVYADDLAFKNGYRALAKVAFLLTKEGALDPKTGQKKVAALIKKADEEVSEELIDRSLPVRVINGVHPIYVTLKTYKSHSSALDGSLVKNRLIDDQVRIFRQKMRVM